MIARAAMSCALLMTSAQVFSADHATESPLTEAQRQGRALFNESCSFCHGERGHATTLLAKRMGKDNAVLEQRKDLSTEFIRYVVRHGINSMPWYRRAELSDGDLNLIANYLTRTNSVK